MKTALGLLIPELRESEDERIRTFLIDYFTSYKIGNVQTKLNGVKIDDIIAYLEKQKEQKSTEMIKDRRQIAFMIEDGRRCGVIEGRKQVIDNPEKYGLQKPTEWSEEDEEMLDAMIDIVSNSLYEPLCPREGMLAWLKSLRPQPKKESVEEKIMNFFDAIGDCGFTQADILKLKSIWKECELPSPQSHWKPSEEQINALQAFVGMIHPDARYNVVSSLLDELKAL